MTTPRNHFTSPQNFRPANLHRHPAAAMPPRLPLPAVSPFLRPVLPVPRRALSTTASLFARPVKKVPKAKSATGGVKQSLPRQKGPREERKAAYAIGERKTLRNRIVLSNTNAEPLDLPALSPELSSVPEAAGNVFVFPDAEIDKLRALHAFGRNQNWHLFAKPSSVLRRQTMELGEFMDSEGKDMRGIVLDGYKGSGKSVMLLQLMTWALQKQWLVIDIPNGIEHPPLSSFLWEATVQVLI